MFLSINKMHLAIQHCANTCIGLEPLGRVMPDDRTYRGVAPAFIKNIRVDRPVIFTARRNVRIASAVLAIAIPSVCLSVRLCSSVGLSHAGIVSKRRHVARRSLHCRIAKCV